MKHLYAVAIDHRDFSVVISNPALPDILPSEAVGALTRYHDLLFAVPLEIDPPGVDEGAWRVVPYMTPTALQGLAYTAVIWAIETAFREERDKRPRLTVV